MLLNVKVFLTTFMNLGIMPCFVKLNFTLQKIFKLTSKMKTFNAKNPSPFTLQSRLRQRELDREWIKRGREGEREVVREREKEI